MLTITSFVKSVRDSEGSFQYGNYYREVDDLRSVMQYFEQEKRTVTAIIGHSKGLFFCFLRI